jgi:enoyl-CoA hydratase/carnithine racemase
VAHDELGAAVDEWAQRIASFSPVVVKLGKDALARSRDLPLDDALELLRAQLDGALQTADAREGVAAFLERREPRWSDR